MSIFSSEKLRSLREYQNLTQETLAEQCGVDTTTISGWEKGKWEPSLQNALSLARALHVSVEDLCDKKEKPDFGKVTMNQIMSCVRELTPTEQAFVLEMVSQLKKLHFFSKS